MGGAGEYVGTAVGVVSYPEPTDETIEETEADDKDE